MEKLKSLIILCLLLVSTLVKGQNNFLFLDAQYNSPRSLLRFANFSDEDGTGLYAKNGGGFHLGFGVSNYILAFFGSYQLNVFGMNYEKFASDLDAIAFAKAGSIITNSFSFGPGLLLPMYNDQLFWSLKTMGGFRIISLPKIDLMYPANYSRFTEVYYAPLPRLSTVYELVTGLQFLFNDQVGIHAELSYIGGRVATINYNYQTKGSKVIDDYDSVNQTIDFINIKVGVVFSL